MFKGALIPLFVMLVVIAAAVAEPCIEKQCTREFRPVSIMDSAQNCRQFSNLCMLENAIHCKRIAPTYVRCMKGTCNSQGDAFPCPDGIW